MLGLYHERFMNAGMDSSCISVPSRSTQMI